MPTTRRAARRRGQLDDGLAQAKRADARKIGRDRWELELVLTEGEKKAGDRKVGERVEVGYAKVNGGMGRRQLASSSASQLFSHSGVLQRGNAQVTPAADSRLINDVTRQVARRVVGQEYMIDRLLISLLTGGHVLLEGVPGLAKTLTVRTLAETIDTTFSRIQFTPDLLPADVVGTQIYDQSTGKFSVKKGPIFANIILADEINRAPAKVQAALLEAMQEKQVTIGGTTFKLEEPFLVLATQNPIEQEGTYPLPEGAGRPLHAQAARRLSVARRRERRSCAAWRGGEPIDVQHVASPKAIMEARGRIAELYMDDRIVDYIVDIVHATREPASAGLPISRR